EESLDHRTDAEESSFRYPGPKPQTKEAGVMMLADAVESASRTLTDPTAKRLETLVHDLTMKRLLDGQFDDCNLTLSELRTIENSLVKSLIGIDHGRFKYPDRRTGCRPWAGRATVASGFLARMTPSPPSGRAGPNSIPRISA